MTVGLDGATVGNVLGFRAVAVPSDRLRGAVGTVGLGPGRVVRGAGHLRPWRGRCRWCRRTQVLLQASVLLRRADAVAVIGAARSGRRSWAGWSPCWWGCRRRRCGVCCGGSQRSPTGFWRCWLRLPPSWVWISCRRRRRAGPVGAVVEPVGALARGATLRLGGSCVPWRLAAVLIGGRLLCPGGPELVAGQVISGNTNSLWSPGAP
jgi:hypothetical protein